MRFVNILENSTPKDDGYVLIGIEDAGSQILKILNFEGLGQ